MTETQTRFLRSIAERVPVDRLVEIHLFPSMKQGAVETGIAVVAAEREPAMVQGELLDAGVGSGEREEVATPIDAPDAAPGAEKPLESPPADQLSLDAQPPFAAPAHPAPAKLTVYSARYRLTLKGPERGRWEVDVTEEADAPMLTVEAVVRGVQRRAGEGAEAERVGAEALRALVAG